MCNQEQIEIHAEKETMKVNVNKVSKTVEFKQFVSVEKIKQLVDYAFAHGDGNYLVFKMNRSDFNHIGDIVNDGKVQTC